MANQNRKKKPNVVRIVLIVLVLCAGVTVSVLSMSKPETEQTPDFNVALQTEEGENTADEYGNLKDESKQEYPVSELESLDVDVFQEKDWVHYLLIGLDNRKDTFQGGRSDALMIFSVNEKEGRMALSSMPRDTFVYINGKGYDKITHTYAYGGAKLLAETIERNFDIAIRHYFTINFAGMEKVVDALGGIDMELTQAESDHMQSFFKVGGTTVGMNTLNGEQALTYCRIRKIDSDFERNRRQYDVLLAIYDKIKEMPAVRYASLITAMYDYFYTDCSLAECIDIAQALMKFGADSIENVKLITGESGSGRKINGTYYFVVSDLEATMKEWRSYLGVTNYVPSAGMIKISDDIKENY